MEPERRRFRRCSVADREVKVLTRKTLTYYPTRNISKVGLAFEYGPVDGPIEGETPESGTIDILAPDYEGQIHLTGVVCKTVYDSATLIEGRSFSGGHLRVRGLEFIGLSYDQEKKLDELLDQCFERMA